MVDISALVATYKIPIAQCKDTLSNENAAAAIAKLKTILTPELLAEIKAKYVSLPEAEREEALRSTYLRLREYLHKECPERLAEVDKFIAALKEVRGLSLA